MEIGNWAFSNNWTSTSIPTLTNYEPPSPPALRHAGLIHISQEKKNSPKSTSLKPQPGGNYRHTLGSLKMASHLQRCTDLQFNPRAQVTIIWSNRLALVIVMNRFGRDLASTESKSVYLDSIPLVSMSDGQRKKWSFQHSHWDRGCSSRCRRTHSCSTCRYPESISNCTMRSAGRRQVESD